MKDINIKKEIDIIKEIEFERGANWGFWIGGLLMWVLAYFVFPCN